MACLLHDAEGIDYPVGVERPIGQRRQRFLAEHGHDLAEEPSGELGTTGQQLVGIDAK